MIQPYLLDKKIKVLKLDEVEKQLQNNPDYNQIVTLPNGDKQAADIKYCLKQYVESNTQQPLDICLFFKVEHEYKVVNIFMIPMVESA